MNDTLHLLVIEDNPEDRALLIRALRRTFSHIQITEVRNTHDLTAALEQFDFDLVITDYQLLWTTGLEVLRTIKARYPAQPVIMFTNTGTQEISVEAMKSGLDDYVVKSPRHFVRLQAAVRAVLERTAERRQLAAVQMELQSLLDQLQVGVFRCTPDGKLMQGNTAFLRLLGVETLTEAQGLDLHALASVPQDGHAASTQDLTLRRADGSSVWVALHRTARHTMGHTMIDGILEDITARKRTEAALQTALRDKDVLLHELHHRVKNNLQVVASLLHLQADAVEDPQIATLFEESQRRVHTMALLHDMVYQTNNFTALAMAPYLHNVANALFASYGLDPERITLRIDLDDIALPIDQAIPCGLLLSELLSNCCKHAFAEGQSGSVTVTLRRLAAEVISLTVQDSGGRFPAEVDLQHTESLGLQLVCSLTEQLSGTITLDRGAMTTFTATFPTLVSGKWQQ
jgi:PAS domain S-box-containing protein